MEGRAAPIHLGAGLEIGLAPGAFGEFAVTGTARIGGLSPRGAANGDEHQSEQANLCAHVEKLTEVAAASVRRFPHAPKRSCESCRSACGRNLPSSSRVRPE